jgi:hypothetical protein
MIYLIILIIFYKILIFFTYIWSKLKLFDFSRSENNIYFGMEGVVHNFFNHHKTSTINNIFIYQYVLNSKHLICWAFRPFLWLVWWELFNLNRNLFKWNKKVCAPITKTSETDVIDHSLFDINNYWLNKSLFTWTKLQGSQWLVHMQ